MCNEKLLLEAIRNIGEYSGLWITQKQLEVIELSEEVEECEYVGLKDGHSGAYTYHVKLVNDENIRSLYLED